MNPARVTLRMPLGRALLSLFFLACAAIGVVASMAAWFYLMTTICSNPRAPVPETQHVIPYNCHGMKVFLSPWQDLLLHWLTPVGMLFMGLAVLAAAPWFFAFRRAVQGGGQVRRVRIVAVPPGEAPQWVREQWVGLELPLAQDSPAAQTWHAAGVLTGPKGLAAMAARRLRGDLDRRRGFAVDVQEALAILEDASPEAARWWRTHAAHLVQPGRCFVFAESVCTVPDGAAGRGQPATS